MTTRKPGLVHAVRTTIRNLVLAAVGVMIVSAAIGALFSPSVAVAAACGGLIGVALAGINAGTLWYSSQHKQLLGAFIMGDYLLKFLVILATILIVRSTGILPLKPLAGVLVASFVIQTAVQIFTLSRNRGPVVDPK
ncbi:hypothetical protein [Gleimia hominis]|uniref:hypothetical protein n=1 Tax=Gleimia hominis TaxID=595468 RepID=UPI000C7FF42C|nr:hypothetical protein [Gleimia hominis]WIK64825.1 hypothetical protein CJ187_001815 [Gleimia hominis]